MKKIKSRIQEDALLFRMVAFFSVVSIAIILVLTTVFFSVINTELKGEIFRAEEQKLKQISNSVNFRAEYANSIFLQVKEDKYISKLFYSTDESDILAGVNGLNNFRATVNQLHSVYLCSEKQDRIYNSGMNELGAINQRSSFADAGFIDILDSIEDYPKFNPILRKLSVVLPTGKEYECYVYTYLVYDSYKSGGIHNVVAFNFFLNWIDDAVGFLSDDSTTTQEVWIVDDESQIVYSSSGSLVGSYCSPDVVNEEALAGDSGYMIIGKGNARKMMVYAKPSKSEYNAWTFISFSNYSGLTASLRQLRCGIYLSCALILCISIFAIFKLSKVIYKPVKSTIDHVKLLEEENRQKSKAARMVFLRKLFLGTVADDINVISERMEKNRISFPLQDDIQVALASVDDGNGFLKTFGKQMDEVSETIEQVLSVHFTECCGNVLCARMHTGLWAVCFPVPAAQNVLQTLFSQTNHLLGERLGISVSMAVSQIGHSVRDIPYLYSDAADILSYRFLWGQKHLIPAEDIQQRGQAAFDYPSETEKKFVSHLLGGKTKEASEDYEEFVAAIRCFTVDEIRLSFLLLAHAVKGACQKSMAEPSSVISEFDIFCKKLQTVESICDVHEMYNALIKEITDKQKRNSKEKHEKMLARIESYVEDNYGNINLSMNDISDQVNMSSAYLGRLFKQVTGNTFSEYLTKFRLNKACYLLRNTELTINDISDQVGFTNSSYFYIIFKKNLECTPSQYRKQYGRKAEGESGTLGEENE